MYLKRHLENVLTKAEKQTKVVLLTGPRQVGKTTAVREMFHDYEYVTLDDENELRLALQERSLFFRERRFPIIIDEVQYAKELLREIKLVVDRRKEKGQILLTGSQTYELLGMSAETLSGRVSILEMPPLSWREISGADFREPFLPTPEYIKSRAEKMTPCTNLWETIHRGFMPELLDAERDWEWFYRDYVRTYIERDIQKVLNIRDEMKFREFLISLAARSAQLLVYEDIARDIGVDIKTVQRWTSVIAASGLVKIIHPYANNVLKRAIKTPKVFFMDTGLLCYLIGWKTAESAKNGAMAGSIFETFVVSEVLKSYLNAGKDLTSIFYYRDKDKKEIDLLLEDGNSIYPVEIKKSASVRREWDRYPSVLSGIPGKKLEKLMVLCQVDKKVPISEKADALPLEYI